MPRVVWVGGKKGLYRFGGTGWTSYTSANSPLPASQTGVWDIEASSATELYLALRTGGVVHLEHQGDALPVNDTWTIHDRSTVGDAMGADTFHAVAVHPDGALYAGCFRGLSVLDGATWTGYSTAGSDLGYDQICDIDFDAQGRVWLATFGGGLVRFDPAVGTFENFDITEGTVHGRFNNTVEVGSMGVFAASLRAGGISLYTGS